MTKDEREWLKDIVILLPAAHVLMAASYLLSFHLGFGWNLVVFASPADLFSVSLSDVALGYITVLIGVGAGLWIARPDKPAPPPSGEASRTARIADYILYAALSVGVILGFAIYFKTGAIFVHYFSLPLSFAIGSIAMRLGRKIGLSFGRRIGLATFFLMIVLVSSSGFSDGQYDRMQHYAKLSSGRPSCNGSVVLRSLGANLLAARPDQSRVIIDTSCAVKFVVFPSSSFAPLPAESPLSIILG